jgi:protein-S-isoprenylcysteine O-methyltransferase Ste14
VVKPHSGPGARANSVFVIAVRRWLKTSSNRTFVVYPVCVIAFELAVHRASHASWATFATQGMVPWGIVLLAWGYLQYRLVGRYRMRLGGGGPGIAVPPERIVAQGPYRVVRNPMYLGHLIFLMGLALTFRSWVGLALFAFHVVWFHRRVLEDEARLLSQFGDSYRVYMTQVKRWIPGIV